MGRYLGRAATRATTLRAVVRGGASQLGVHTASALSPPLSLSLLSPSLPPSPRCLSLSPPLPLSFSKGSGAQGFGTERARLVVQVKRLWCTRLQHRTCKTSGSSQKKGLLPMGILIFFSQNTSDFEN